MKYVGDILNIVEKQGAIFWKHLGNTNGTREDGAIETAKVYEDWLNYHDSSQRSLMRKRDE
ncbi:MAG: hypothetical protein D6704_12285 [Nitrospirae bacterium]|nr:MAG: hypothetical protein D6704_12285 [Nitrospirota bacterium]